MCWRKKIRNVQIIEYTINFIQVLAIFSLIGEVPDFCLDVLALPRDIRDLPKDDYDFRYSQR